MRTIDASPDRIIQLGYEGEDKTTTLCFSYTEDWLADGAGHFDVRVLRHGETEAYNAVSVTDDRENLCLLMTVTDVELSIRGYGEMQVVYAGADFVRKSPVYRYNVSRAIDGEIVNPPEGSIINQIVRDLAAVKETKTDKSYVDDAVQGLQNAVQSKADTSTVTALSGTVSNLSDAAQQYMEYTNSAITNLRDSKANKSDVDSKASKSYVDTQLATKASTAPATASADGLMSAQDKTRLDAVYADYSAAFTALGGGS